MSPTSRDDDHLRLLSILHYVLGGLTAAMSCFGLLYVLIAFGVITATAGHGSPPPWAGLFVFLVAGGAVAVAVIMGGLMVYAGHCLATRRQYTFCLVVAALSCLSVPVGTALGVFTLIVLMRPEVKESFGSSPRPPSPA